MFAYQKGKTALFMLGIVLVAVLGYTLFQARDFLRGPTVEFINPGPGQTFSKSFVEIEGRAENISRIRMNDRQIFVNEEGIFKEKLLLSYGYNIITVAAEDRFGRAIKEELELIYK